MKSRVIQDDPDDDRPPRPADPLPVAAARGGLLTRVLKWFGKR
jgi:hypothetical protein